MSRREHIVLLCSALVGALAIVLVDVAALADTVPVLAPFLVLVALLVRGRYVGEQRLANLAARRTSRPRRRPTTALVRIFAPRVLIARGSELLGRALAVRPPPVASLA